MNLTKNPSKHLVHWLEEFQDYDLKIIHKPGKEMVVTNAISRQADYKEGYEGGNHGSLNTMEIKTDLYEWVESMPEFLCNRTLTQDKWANKMMEKNKGFIQVTDNRDIEFKSNPDIP